MSLKPTAQNEDKRRLALVPPADSRIMSQTHSKRALAAPKTIQQRMAARRIELGMSHGDIAERIHVTRTDTETGKKKRVGIARNTYCNYERSKIPPKVDVLAQIARILKVPLEYLLLGNNNTTILPRVEYDADTKNFEETQDWSIDHDWLAERFGGEANKLVVSLIPTDTVNRQAGEMAFLSPDVKPSSKAGEYIFVIKGKVKAAKVVRTTGSAMLRIYDREGEAYDEVPQSKVVVLGEIVGGMG